MGGSKCLIYVHLNPDFHVYSPLSCWSLVRGAILWWHHYFGGTDVTWEQVHDIKLHPFSRSFTTQNDGQKWMIRRVPPSFKRAHGSYRYDYPSWCAGQRTLDFMSSSLGTKLWPLPGYPALTCQQRSGLLYSMTPCAASGQSVGRFHRRRKQRV
jgi:hypothetical protein